MAIVNTTFRAYVEKLGATEAATFIGNEGDLFYDPNTASLRVSDGTTPGGVPVAGVSTVSGPIQQSLVPDADATYDLGSPTNQWRDLYLTNTTMYLGGTAVAISTGGKLAVDGEDVALESEIAAETNTRLVVNTDRKVYSEGSPGVINPNANAGGWYHTTLDGSYIRWNFWTPKPNADGPVGQLGNLEAGWCLFTPWSTDTDYPFFQFYTTPKLGGGNSASWYRSRVTYTRAPEAHIPGTPVLLHFGPDPVDVYPGVPRREMTEEALSTEGPRDADEAIFASYLGSSTGKADGYMNFSSATVGFQYSGTEYSYGLYAVPENVGLTTSAVVSGTTFTIENGLIVGITT